MVIHCEERGSGGECGGAVRAYTLQVDGLHIAVLCEVHRKPREDVAVRGWGELVFPEARTEEIVGLYRDFLEAQKSFVQRFDAAATCDAADGGCSGGIASYYFSSAETRALCEGHCQDSHAMMSVQYHDEVYEKWGRLHAAWCNAMSESRAAATALKK